MTKLKDWYGEKTQQVSPDKLMAFGIKIDSRYGKVNEMIEMLKFVSAASVSNICHYIQELFYDTKSCCCFFKLHPDVEEGDPIWALILQLAKNSISQFQLFDDVYYDHEHDQMMENEGE